MTYATTVRHQLGQLIEGRVADAGEPDYVTTIQIDNGRVNHEPKAVVIPSTTADVAAAVKFAATNQVRLTTKSGGHSATGYSLNSEGIVLDMRELRHMSFDRQSGALRVGAGARWRDVYDYMELTGTNCIPIGGGCRDVGVGGFLMGGGFSFVSRSYGLGADSIRSFTCITADGTVLSVTPKEHDDLFWACRGGGGGNFVIVSELEIQTHTPQANTMLVGQVLFPFYRVEEVLDFYNAWVEDLPPEMAVYGFVGNQPDTRKGGTPVLSLRFTPVFNGSFVEGVALLQPLIRRSPLSVELHDMTLPEWEDWIGGITLVGGRSAYMRSVVLPPRGLTPAVSRIFMKHMARCPSLSSFMVWTHTGGAIEKVADDATPFPHRTSRFVPEIKAIWDSSKPEETRHNVEWAYDFFEELGQHGVGAYLNYIDPLLPDWTRQYYGANYDRLLKTLAKWDPTGVFAFQQGVGSEFRPSTVRPLDLSPLFNT